MDSGSQVEMFTSSVLSHMLVSGQQLIYIDAPSGGVASMNMQTRLSSWNSKNARCTHSLLLSSNCSLVCQHVGVDNEGKLVAIDARSGNAIWNYTQGVVVGPSDVVVDSENTVIAAWSNGSTVTVAAISADSGLLVWTTTLAGKSAKLAIDATGHVIALISSNDGGDIYSLGKHHVS
jgi:outer membrane protein assembly factor BamB